MRQDFQPDTVLMSTDATLSHRMHQHHLTTSGLQSTVVCTQITWNERDLSSHVAPLLL